MPSVNDGGGGGPAPSGGGVVEKIGARAQGEIAKPGPMPPGMSRFSQTGATVFGEAFGPASPMGGIFSLGSIGSPCCCGECFIRIFVAFCSSPLPGASVTISNGGGVVATGITDINGHVFPNIGTAGTFTIVITKSGYPTITHTLAFACGGSYNFGYMGVCVFGCGVYMGTCQDATVEILDGTTVLLSLTTDSDGCVRFERPPGTLTLKVTSDGYADFTEPLPACGSGIALQVGMSPAPGFICCSSSVPFFTMTVNDANGSWPLHFTGGIWNVSYFIDEALIDKSCLIPAASYNNCVEIAYEVVCLSSPPHSIMITRKWISTDGFCTGGVPKYAYDGTFAIPGCTYLVAFYGGFIGLGCCLTNSQTDFSTFTFTISDLCAPDISGGLTEDPGNILADPVGGIVTLT